MGSNLYSVEKSYKIKILKIFHRKSIKIFHRLHYPPNKLTVKRALNNIRKKVQRYW